MLDYVARSRNGRGLLADVPKLLHGLKSCAGGAISPLPSRRWWQALISDHAALLAEAMSKFAMSARNVVWRDHLPTGVCAALNAGAANVQVPRWHTSAWWPRQMSPLTAFSN